MIIVLAGLILSPVGPGGCGCAAAATSASDSSDTLAGKAGKGGGKAGGSCGRSGPPGDQIKKPFGSKGTRFTSRTYFNGAAGQYRYRIDAENPAPGQRAGNIHVQLGGEGSTHYYYAKKSKSFAAKDGTPLLRAVSDDIDRDPRAQRALQKALKELGE